MTKHQRQTHKQQKELLPFEVIKAATTGDPDAINVVLLYHQHVLEDTL